MTEHIAEITHMYRWIGKVFGTLTLSYNRLTVSFRRYTKYAKLYNHKRRHAFLTHGKHGQKRPR